MLKEFKEFALRGNVVDLAVAVIIGGAFAKIIASFVSDIIMPPIGMMMGGVNFSDLFIALDGNSYASLAAAKEAGAATINYGVFLTTIIDFVIVALALFFIIKAMNAAKKKEAAAAPAAPTTKTCPHCATEIPLAATRCPHCTSQL